jgi:hypothetical protein
MASEKIILTEEQKRCVDENFDKTPNMKDLARIVFNDPTINGNFKQAHAVRDYIASDEFQKKKPGAKLKTTKYVKGEYEKVELTPEHKLLIRNNLGKMSWGEMAKLIFNDPTLTPLNAESKAVYEYCLQIDPASIPDDEKLTEEEQYKAPTSIDRLVTKVNKYRFKFNGDKSKVLDRNDLRPVDKKNLESLLGYMNVFRFVQQACKYTTEEDRSLFESLFVRYCYDKPDLLEEEVDNYVVMCAEAVTVTQLEKTVQLLRKKLNDALQGETEGKSGMTKTFADLINGQMDKLNHSKKNYQSLMDKLVGERSERLKGKIQQSATIINLIDAVKMEERRIQLLKIAEKQKMLESEEIDALSSMDSVIALIAGISKERAKYG